MKKKKVTLVASQLPCCQINQGYIFFLNEFSKNYELYKNYPNKNIKTIKHPWVNESKKKKDEEYTKRLAKKLTYEIGLKLNKIHKINKTKKYWDFLLLLWTYNYVSLYLEKWRCIEEFLKKIRNKNFYTACIKISNNYEIATTNDFYKISQKDFYNQIIIQNILKFKKIKNISYKNFTIRLFKKKNKKFRILKLLRSFLFKFALKNNQYFFDAVLPLITYFKVCISLKLIPFLIKNDDLYDYKSSQLKKSLRKKININFNIKNTFELFLASNIKYEIPKIFIESYKDLILSLKKIKCKKIKYISGYHFWRDDIIKIWIAENSKNIKLIVMDHGGLFPIKNTFSYYYPSTISNYYLSFINDKNFSFNNTNIQISRISKKKFNMFTFKKKNKILFVLNQFFRFRVNVGGAAVGEQNLEIIRSMGKIFENLPSKIIENIRLRNYGNFKWQLLERLKDSIGLNIKKQEYWSNKPLKKLLPEIKIFISTYPDTVFLDGIDNNIPSILFLNKFWRVKNQYFENYNILKKARILFDDEKKLAVHLKKIYNDPKKWWLSNQTQAAVKKINNFYFTDNVQNKTKEFLNEIKAL
jgi:putative transferase (TIGR04331 family)